MLNGIEEIDLTAPDAKEKINALAEGLANKNKELLSKVSSKDENNAATAAELEALRGYKTQAEIQKAKDDEKWQDALELEKNSFQSQLKDIETKNSAYEQQITKLLIDDGLNKALDGVNIDPNLKAGAEAMLRTSATISDGQAMIGDKSLSEAVKEWSQTDAGKAFCLAPNNTGGNATGGSTTAGQNNKPYSEMTLQERAKLNTA